MREIILTRGFVALVDDADFEVLSRWKWTACKKGYAYRLERVDGRKKKIPMHRFLMGLDKGDAMHVDHINGNPLDNRRANLRLCTASENACNRRRYRDSKSGYKGVTWSKAANKWKAQIRIQGRLIYLGVYAAAEDAFDAYKVASAKYHGEFGRIA